MSVPDENEQASTQEQNTEAPPSGDQPQVKEPDKVFTLSYDPYDPKSRVKAEEAKPDSPKPIPSGETGPAAPPPSGEDPLSSLDIKSIIEHPKLGPKLQSWADRGANAQVSTAVARARAEIEGETQLNALTERFKGMEPEELGRALTDPATAEAYASIIARDKAIREQASTDEISSAAETLGFAIQIAQNQAVIEGSGLSPEVKASLSPDNFKHMGREGIPRWGEAIYNALVEKAVEDKVQGLLDERWEAFKEGRLAELDSGSAQRGRDITNGRHQGPITGEALKKMTPQEAMAIPKEQREAALRAYPNERR
jgi:hypothetical protein